MMSGGQIKAGKALPISRNLSGVTRFPSPEVLRGGFKSRQLAHLQKFLFV